MICGSQTQRIGGVLRYRAPEDLGHTLVAAAKFREEPTKVIGRAQQFHCEGLDIGDLSPLAHIEIELLVDRVIPWHFRDKELNPRSGISRHQPTDERAYSFLTAFRQCVGVVDQNIAKAAKRLRPIAARFSNHNIENSLHIVEKPMGNQGTEIRAEARLGANASGLLASGKLSET